MAQNLSDDTDLDDDSAPRQLPVANWQSGDCLSAQFGDEEIHLSSELDGIRIGDLVLKSRGPPDTPRTAFNQNIQIKPEPREFHPVCFHGNHVSSAFARPMEGLHQSLSADQSNDISMDNASFNPATIKASRFHPNIGSHPIKSENQQSSCNHGNTIQGQCYFDMSDGYAPSQVNSAPGNQDRDIGCHSNIQDMAPAPSQIFKPLSIFRPELDENGECHIHYLSMVTDPAQCREIFMRYNSEFQQIINLQNRQQQTPLFLAVQQQNLCLVELLLAHGADPNMQGAVQTDRDNYVWRGPLHLAVLEGDRGITILQRLLTSQPRLNINARTIGDRMTSLHLALRRHRDFRDSKRTIFTLLHHGADIKLKEEKSSRSILMLVLETRDIELVRDFLNDLNPECCRQMVQEQMRSGDTCLHVAAGLSNITPQSKEHLLRLLVLKGANGNVANNGKEYPRDYAKREWDRIKSM